jgi:hypothetical protein
MSSSQTSGAPTLESSSMAGSDARGDPLGIAQGDLLRHELADDQREIGDRDDHEADAETVRHDLRQALPLTSHSDSRAPSVAPEKAPESTPTSVMPIWTVERKRPGLFCQAQRGGGALAALIAENLEAGGTGGDHRQFGHGEQTVDDGQGHDDQNFG